jgi:hypothetical protein
MRGRYFWLLVVLTSLTVAGQPQAWGSREPDPSAETKVSFELYRDYLIVVHGSAGSLKDLNFLLDTGANLSVLDPRIATKLHLPVTPTDVAVLGGNARGGVATLPSLQLGPARKSDFRVLVEDMSFIQNALPFRIDGIVGLDVLSQSAFVIDYASREIRFGPAPPMPLSTPLQMKHGLAIVDATVNHASDHLLLDTGASSLVLFDQMPPPPASLKVAATHPSSKPIGSFAREQTRRITLKLGDTDFGSQSAFMVQNSRDAGHDFDGLIGPAALSITRVAIDPAQGTFAFIRKP